MSELDILDYRKVSDEVMNYIRMIAVNAINNKSYSVSDVANFLGVSVSAVYAWLEKYLLDGKEGLRSKDAPGKKPIISEYIEEWLKDTILESTPKDFGFDTEFWNCSILADLIKINFDLEVSISSISRHLKKIGLSYQRPGYRSTEQSEDKIQTFLKHKFPRIQRLAKKIDADIGFEDESGVKVSECKGKTWGVKGCTPQVYVPLKRGGYNVLSYITNQGVLQYSVTDKNIDSDKFISFLKQIIRNRSRPLILIIDRASFHTSKKVRDFVRSHRHQIRIFFLPTHSPQLNPDEKVWNDIKNNRLRKSPSKTKQELKQKLYRALRRLQNNTSRVASFFMDKETKYASLTPDLIA